MHMDPASNLIQEITIDPNGDQIPSGIIGFGETEAGELLIAVTEWNSNSTGRIIALVDGLAPGLDRDNDSIDDDFDNCLEIPNGPNDTATAGPSQNDSDNDGYGNMCDADFNNNGVVDSNDASVLFATFGDQLGVDPGYDSDVDLNGNNVIDSNDAARLFGTFGQQPGPSALAQ
jgi:hypothetical protein